MKMRGAKWVVLWSLWLARLVRQPSVEVAVSGGTVRGSVSHDGSHVNYFAIPYATVTRENRFQAPGPEPSWEGLFEAINENTRCLQEFSGILIGQENCLTLNVYTPISIQETPRPVMVFIHGGGFFQGSNSKFILGPNYLVKKDVVLVSINYRLNIQGYLCLGIKEAPGNAGMKDQVAALKWVKRNIRAFGGDPDNVTIFGESAGASAVSYHVLSPMSKGLFHKAILQSGSSLVAWAHQYRPVYMASLLAKTMGFNSQDPQELYNYFMNKTDEELILTRVPRKEGNLIISELLYVPCSEQVVEGVEPFLTELPYDALSLGNFNKVPMIIGLNSEEGYFFVGYENSTSLSTITIEQSMPKDLVFPTDEERKNAAEKAKYIYMGDDEVQASLLKFSKFSGDLYFEYPAVIETELILGKTDEKVYNYLLNYTSWRNLPKMMLGHPFKDAPGATHADDLFYLFQQTILPTFFEMEMITRITTLWTNFAKYGDPTPETTELLPVKWVPTDRLSPQSFVIDSDFSTTPLWRSKNLRFWHELYTRYRRKH